MGSPQYRPRERTTGPSAWQFARALWVLLLVSVPVTSTLVPTSQQTAEQRRVRAHWGEPAATASAAAAASTAALFAHPATTRHLKLLDDGSALWRVAPDTLANRFWDEIESAEILHNFGNGAWAGSNCGHDLSVEVGRASSVFDNQWVLQARHIFPPDPLNNFYMEWSETKLFNFTPFRHALFPDEATAVSRPVYGALNMFRSSGGNPFCGPVAAVFSSAFIGTDALMSPVDTGLFSTCRLGESAFSPDGNTTMAVCTAWPEPRILGLSGGRSTMQHLLAPYLRFFNQTEPYAGRDYPYYNLARLVTRLLSRRTYGDVGGAVPLPLSFMENMYGYFETDPIVNLTMTGGVKMLVGMFEQLWGTREGVELQVWCVERGWPLVWAYNPTASSVACGPFGTYPGCTPPNGAHNWSVGRDAVNARLLDLDVLQRVPAGQNMTLSAADVAYFEHQWTAVNASASTRATISGAWSAIFDRLRSGAAVEPMHAGSCLNPECVGVTIATRECVC